MANLIFPEKLCFDGKANYFHAWLITALMGAIVGAACEFFGEFLFPP